MTGALHPAAPPLDLPADPVDRILTRVRLRARRCAAWIAALADGAPGTEQAFRAADPAARALGEAITAVEDALAADGGRLQRLVALFDLSPAESDVLQLCLAAALDPAIGRALAVLADAPARCYPTEPIAALVFDHGHRRALSSESALRRWMLVVDEPAGPGEPRALRCDPQISGWLCGEHHLDRGLVGRARLCPPRPPLDPARADACAAELAELVTGGAGVRLRVVGLPGSGRRMFAAAVAHRLDMPLLVVDADAVDDAEWPGLFVRAQRQAFLDRCALAWCGESLAARRWPSDMPVFPLQFLITEDREPVPRHADLIDQTEAIAPLAVAERAALWRRLVPAAAAWPAELVDTLAARHRTTVGDLVDLARRPLASADAAAALLRESSRHRLGELALWIECPFTWDDLVLPPALGEALRDLVHEATDRAAFWEQPAARRLFPHGRGLFALFNGAPGTGKTMAAQVISARLGLDLFRVSLAAVVSKYIGETAKHLQRILSRAEAMDAVLLFDEADALFSRRTEVKDAHDRFANTDTNHLLQAIESYSGIAILASNRKANIDPAFLRRLRYVLEFPRPEVAERRALWQRVVGELAGAERATALAADLETLAEAIDLTGAQIKLAVLGGLFAARRDGLALARAHLLRGLERELGKEGRALSDRDRARLR
ncbi:MAG TPA: ATP-binding protein [Kofleriaceae bacterium]|jgi:hypothetical protein